MTNKNQQEAVIDDAPPDSMTHPSTPQLATKRNENPHNVYLALALAYRDDATPEMLHHLIHNPPPQDNESIRRGVREDFWVAIGEHPNLTEPLMEYLLQESSRAVLGLTANPKTPTRLLKQVASSPPPTLVNNWMLDRAFRDIAKHSNATPEILITINTTHIDLSGNVLARTINNPNTTLEVLEALIPTLKYSIDKKNTTILAEALTQHPKYSTYPKEWVEELIETTR